MKAKKKPERKPHTPEQLAERRARREKRLRDQGYKGPIPGTAEFREARKRGERPLMAWMDKKAEMRAKKHGHAKNEKDKK